MCALVPCDSTLHACKQLSALKALLNWALALWQSLGVGTQSQVMQDVVDAVGVLTGGDGVGMGNKSEEVRHLPDPWHLQATFAA